MDLIDARAYHLAELRRLRGHDPHHPTQRLYGQYERRHLEYLELHHLEPRLEMLNAPLVAGCQLWIREQHKPGSRNGRSAEFIYARIMRIWSRFLLRRRIIPADLLADLEVPMRPKPTRRGYSQVEASAIRDAVALGEHPARNRAIVVVLADTGCRVGELCGLELSDVLDSDGSLRSAILLRHTKGGLSRDVVIAGDRIQQALHDWLLVRRARAGVLALFTSDRGGPLSTRAVRELHHTWGRIAGVSPCYPHRWRHSHATEALAEGVPEHSIRDRLGHVSNDVLSDYLHQSDRTREVAAERSSLSNKWAL